MTFDSYISANWGNALGDLRDKVSGMANWTLQYDGTAGDTVDAGEAFVLGTPAPTEYIFIENVQGEGGLRIQHGDDAAADGTWNNRYDYDPDAVDFGHGENIISNIAPRSGISANNYIPTYPTDDGSYWLEYTPTGFGFYWQREEGDGEDGECFLGLSQVDKTWDYATAQADEAEWVLGMGDSCGANFQSIYMSLSGQTAQDGTVSRREGNNSYGARGHVNPDNAFDNYPLTNNIVSSSKFRNVQGEDTVIGSFNTWGADRAGGDTGHRDLIQDDVGTNIYTVLKRSQNPAIFLRMD